MLFVYESSNIVYRIDAYHMENNLLEKSPSAWLYYNMIIIVEKNINYINQFNDIVTSNFAQKITLVNFALGVGKR